MSCYYDFLQITRAEILYWKVDDPDHFSVGSIPVFKEVTTLDEKNMHQFYTGLPIFEYPGLIKVILQKNVEPLVYY